MIRMIPLEDIENLITKWKDEAQKADASMIKAKGTMYVLQGMGMKQGFNICIKDLEDYLSSKQTSD